MRLEDIDGCGNKNLGLGDAGRPYGRLDRLPHSPNSQLADRDWGAGGHRHAMRFSPARTAWPWLSQGMFLALLCLLPMVLLRAMGAGDWKLMGALGAILGPVMMLFVLAGAIFVSGIMAIVIIIRAKRVKETFINVFVLVQGFLSFGLRNFPDITLDNPDLLKLPFGVAAALATVLCFLATRWKW